MTGPTARIRSNLIAGDTWKPGADAVTAQGGEVRGAGDTVTDELDPLGRHAGAGGTMRASRT